jgi:hypothetical protein
MKRAAAGLLAALLLGGCATAAVSTVSPEGYLVTKPGLRLYATEAQRDAGSLQGCIQIVRTEAAQLQPIPSGRVRVVGRSGAFDGDLRKLQVGQDIAHYELCDSRYIIGAEIVPLNEN